MSQSQTLKLKPGRLVSESDNDGTRVPLSQLVGQIAKRNVSSGNCVSICLCGSENGLQCFVMKLSKHPTVNVISVKQVYNF